MASNWFLAISSEHRTTIDLCNHLVGNYNCNTELISNPLEGSQEFSQVHLPGGEFSTTAEVSSIQSCCAVNNQQGESVLSHQGSCLQKELVLLISVVGACVGNIVKNLLFIETEPLGDRNQSFRAESTFSINIHGHALTTTLSDRQLACYT